MKTVKHEIKLERSVKIILGVLALGIFLNAFATPIAQELFSINDALADWGHNSEMSPIYIYCAGATKKLNRKKETWINIQSLF